VSGLRKSAINRAMKKIISRLCFVHNPFTPVSFISRPEIVELTIGGQLAPARR
jgi:hypothetical protein